MANLTLKHFTLTEYHQLAELGIIGEADRVELIDGQIVEMTAKGTAHEVCITRLIRELSTTSRRSRNSTLSISDNVQ